MVTPIECTPPPHPDTRAATPNASNIVHLPANFRSIPDALCIHIPGPKSTAKPGAHDGIKGQGNELMVNAVRIFGDFREHVVFSQGQRVSRGTSYFCSLVTQIHALGIAVVGVGIILAFLFQPWLLNRSNIQITVQ